MDLDDDTVGDLAIRVADALVEQAELHVELAKAELARDSAALTRDLLPLAAGLPLLGIGYVFACVAAALALAPLIGAAGGFAVLALVNLLAGAVAVRTSLTHLRSRRLFDATVGHELGTSARTLLTALLPTPPSAQTEVPPAR